MEPLGRAAPFPILSGYGASLPNPSMNMVLEENKDYLETTMISLRILSRPMYFLWPIIYLIILYINIPGILVISDQFGITYSKWITQNIAKMFIQKSALGSGLFVLTGDPEYQRPLGWEMDKVTGMEFAYTVSQILAVITRYPPGLLEEKGIRGFVIGKHLHHCYITLFCDDSGHESGRAQRPLGLIAVSVYDSHALQTLLLKNWIYVLNHEIGHYFMKDIDERAWGGCNGSSLYRGKYWDKSEFDRQFVSAYSQSNFDEDVAETVAVIMTSSPSELAELLIRPALRCKHSILREARLPL